MDGMDVDSSCLSASVDGNSAMVGFSTPLPACLQDCVRLGAVDRQPELKLLGAEILNWCSLHGRRSVEPWHVLVGLADAHASSQQRQLFGLMCSLLKSLQPQAAAAPGVQNGIKQGRPRELKGILTVAEVAAAAISMQRQHTAASGAASNESSTQQPPAAAFTAADSVAAPAAVKAPQGPSNYTNTSKPAALMVLWLVLWGRYCLILARPLYFGAFSGSIAGQRLVGQDLVCLQSWLQDSSTSMQLDSIGLNPTCLLQALQDAVMAWTGLQGEGGAGAQSADLARQKLHALGVSLSSLPLSWGCSNPVCTNLQGSSEEGIVQGKGHVCRACRMARYCGKACQAVHWKQHKPVCQAVAAAAAEAKLKQ